MKLLLGKIFDFLAEYTPMPVPSLPGAQARRDFSLRPEEPGGLRSLRASSGLSSHPSSLLLLPLPPPAHEAAHVGVEECEGLGQQSTNIAQPQHEDW